MNISMDKKYTLNGSPFTVVTVTKPGSKPVLGYLPSGLTFHFPIDGKGMSSLVEVSPYADFLVDEKVMVRDYDLEEWERACFVGIDKLGIAEASFFCSWVRSRTKAVTWGQCRRPTAEELAE